MNRYYANSLRFLCYCRDKNNANDHQHEGIPWDNNAWFCFNGRIKWE